MYQLELGGYSLYSGYSSAEAQDISTRARIRSRLHLSLLNLLYMYQLELRQVQYLGYKAGHLLVVGQVCQELVVPQDGVRGTGGHSLPGQPQRCVAVEYRASFNYFALMWIRIGIRYLRCKANSHKCPCENGS